MTDRNETVLPETDEADDAILDLLIEAYNTAIMDENGKDPTFDSPVVRQLQRIGMRAALGSKVLNEYSRAAYYKGRKFSKRMEFDKREKIIEDYIERAAHWKSRAKTAEGELRKMREATEQANGDLARQFDLIIEGAELVPDKTAHIDIAVIKRWRSML